MESVKPQFYSLYLTQFASSFGFITLITLLPTYIELLNPSGLTIGLFITALGVARTVAIVPLGWGGDRYDKRTLLLVSLVCSVVAYVGFTFVTTSAGFIVARFVQGLGIVGVGLLGLAMIGELAPAGRRANYIGKYNAWRMAAGIGGTLGAGALYEFAGFEPVFALLVVLLTVATVGVWRFVDADATSVEGFAFTDLAINRRILTLTSFRAQYAVAVTLVRTWVPIYVGVSVVRGGLGVSALLVGVAVASEKFTNMLCQPYTGRLSDRYGRALFVFVGGGCYGLVALAIPSAAQIGAFVPQLSTLPGGATVPAAFAIVVLLNGLLGVADSLREPASMALFADEGEGEGIASSIGIRELVWRPGAMIAPLVGGYLMTEVGMEWVFYLGGAAALSGVVTFYVVLARSRRRNPLAVLTEW